jgi:hypothetical protein
MHKSSAKEDVLPRPPDTTVYTGGAEVEADFTDSRQPGIENQKQIEPLF